MISKHEKSSCTIIDLLITFDVLADDDDDDCCCCCCYFVSSLHIYLSLYIVSENIYIYRALVNKFLGSATN